MRTIAEVIKRLYKNGELTKEQVAKRVEKGTITKSEYKEITGEEYEG